MRVLAIDPANEKSAFVICDDYQIIAKGKVNNLELLEIVETWKYDELVIEMIASFGMPVGNTIFETCVFIGEIKEICRRYKKPFHYVYRKNVKMNLCGSLRKNDSDVIKSLVKRFAKSESNHGKGTNKKPDYFHGFKADIWQAYAVAVTFLDERQEDE